MLDENNLNKNSKETTAKLKIKEYFINNKTLTHNKFNEFLEYIGIREIWSTEQEQNLLWDSIIANAKDKNNINYDSVIGVINSFFDEDDGKDLSGIYNENENFDNINLKDINKKSSNSNISDSKKILSDERCIDEFLKSLNKSQDTLYYIRFINEIFFNENKKNEEMEKVSFDEIIEKIKKDYKFININTETLREYLNYLKENKNLDNQNHIMGFSLKKDLIDYVNAIVDLKIDENNKNHNINLNNSLSNNNINGNSIEFSIEKLSLSDTNVIHILDGIISLNSNIDFIKLSKKYIENYILYLRQSIYNEIKSKELEFQQKITQSNNTCNKCCQNIDIENKKITTLLRKNSKLKYRYNNGLSENKIVKINEEIKKTKNSSSINLRNSLSMPKEQKRKYTQLNKIPSKHRLYQKKLSNDNIYSDNSISNNNNRILKSQSKIYNGNKSRTYSSTDGYIGDDITNSKFDIFSNYGNGSGDQFLFDTTKLYNENGEEEDKSISNKISFKQNNKNNQLLLTKQKPSPKNKKINSADISSDTYNESSIKINNEDNFDDDEDMEVNFLDNGKLNNSNNFFSKKYFSTNSKDYIINGNYNIRNTEAFQSIKTIDNCYSTFAYAPSNGQMILDFNKKNNFEERFMIRFSKKFYDFRYLGYSHRVKRILSSYNEKINLEEFLSDEIIVHFSKKNKQICVFIITCNNFFFLKPDSLDKILTINLNKLESISISSNNCNLLLLSFKESIDIIIESFQRMEILIFLQKVLAKRKLEKDIKINSTNKFYFRKKNGKKDIILTFKNKKFNLTPNFENAKKIGILLKYQENIFSGSFHKKLVVLCSLGLLYFEDNYKIPKAIIPIIGTTIKPIIVQTNEMIYCLKLITINEEVFIFGSLKKNEILDWRKELQHLKKKYDFEMKQINPNYSRKSSKFDNRNDEDIFFKKSHN